MEITSGIYRLEPYIGKKLVAHHLIMGERSLFIDAGTPELAREALLPWLSEMLGDPARLDMLLVTHADVDHYGGLELFRQACPQTTIIGPALDRSWIESPEQIFAERYDAYHAEHGLTYEPELTHLLHSWIGKPVPLDMGLVGGEEIRCGQHLVLQILHVPGHTPGHLMLWEPKTQTAIIGDALNGMTQLDCDGNWTAPPPYTSRVDYLQSIQKLRALNPRILLTGHYPVMRGNEITAFMNASQDFIFHTDQMLADLFQAAPDLLTLAQLIDLANSRLGPFAFARDLQFALEAHLAALEQQHRLQRYSRDGVIAWKWIPEEEQRG